MGKEPRNGGSAIRTLSAFAAIALLLAVAPKVDAQVRLVSATRTNGEASREPAYVDRVIEGLASGADDAGEREVTYDRSGWPRFLRLETRLGTQPYDERSRSVGFSAAGAIETPNHGLVSIDANVAPDEGRSAITLRQVGLPMEGGWRVNSELGVTTPLPPAIMRTPSRVYVPFLYTRGASTEWLNDALKTQLLASTGEPGRLQGYPVAGFRSLPGTVTTVGAQGTAEDWRLAVRHAHAEGISRLDDPLGPADFINTDSTHVAARRESANHSIQANLVTSRANDVANTRFGAWIDGEWKQGTSLYGWGAYHLQRDLGWAGQGMASDLEGAYARASWRKRQWSTESSVDVLRAVSGSEETGVLATASGRWRYSRTLTLGAGGSVRRYKGNSGTGFADARWQGDLGTSGLRAEFSDFVGQRSRRATVDHNWRLPLGWALNTSLTAGRESGTESSGSLWGAAVSFSAPLTGDLVLGGNATTERDGTGNQQSSANVSLTWKLGPNWAIEGNYIYSRGRQAQVAPIDPLAPPPDRLFNTADTRSLYFVVRYEARAGSRAVPLGGAPLGGGGSIEGVVFMDANRNGAREAAEAGAAGVTVVLDGRYTTRTDSQGRFTFPFVASGQRSLALLNETLPLPWEVGERAQVPVEVIVREAARVAVPVVRRGGD